MQTSKSLRVALNVFDVILIPGSVESYSDYTSRESKALTFFRAAQTSVLG